MFVKELSELISTKQKDGLIVVTYGFRCKLVMQYYKFAYYAFEGTESQIMNMKNSMKYRLSLFRMCLFRATHWFGGGQKGPPP